MRRIFLSAAVILAISPIGCTTYSTRKVTGTGSTRGYPFIFLRPCLVHITYTDGTTSVHFAGIPTLYAVDTDKAAFGITKTEFENGADGFALKTKTDLDQKIPENLAAVSDLLKTLGVTATGAPAAPGSPTAKFEPDIDPSKAIQSVRIENL